MQKFYRQVAGVITEVTMEQFEVVLKAVTLIASTKQDAAHVLEYEAGGNDHHIILLPNEVNHVTAG